MWHCRYSIIRPTRNIFVSGNKENKIGAGRQVHVFLADILGVIVASFDELGL